MRYLNSIERFLARYDSLMEICTNVDVNPNDVVENRTDIEAEFNEPFLESAELNTLW